uniref:Conserved oligomeric Golgi complex subunit 3 n=1 Tax=Mucochytrium quahogii TaxID=96639 RepID=A0A7S2RU93_9STRA|mmetsp:Transcript_20142/g.43567  ORF Transcript_20142/g.43567 Transcript_20142/m.43567 type:complete len:726 (+) Transcript_20142:336-2513(+)
MSAYELSPEVDALLLDVDQATHSQHRDLRRRHSSVQARAKVQEEKPQDGMLVSPLEFWSYVQEQEKDGGLQGMTIRGDKYSSQSKVLEESVRKLGEYMSICDLVVENIQKGEELLNDLELKHQTVAQKTSSLHETCKKLLEEQQRFEKIVKDIEVPMEYLREVDRIGPLLGIPMETRLKSVTGPPEKGTVRPLNPDSPQFFGILKRIDECINYWEENTHFKDYEEYESKLHTLQLRGLTLIRNMVVDSIRATTTSARIGIESKYEQLLRGGNAVDKERITAFDAERNSLMYIRFRAQAKHLRMYIEELESRLPNRVSGDLLFSCQQSYCGCRLELLRLVAFRSKELSPSGSDLTACLRVATPYLLNQCKIEYRLFHEFFTLDSVEQLRFDHSEEPNSRLLARRVSVGSVGSDSVAGFTETPERDAYMEMMTELCTKLYDLVRPLVVKMNDMRVLCDTVGVIEGEILEGQVERLGEAGEPVRGVLIQILQDVQERLIYSASQYIQLHITNFSPQAGDLRYPEKLIESSKGESRPGMTTGCFKTLENTLMCLIQIYRCLEPQTFEELAQEAVMACSHSLTEASREIGKRSRVDGDLFLIKHLLVLREQISPFNTQLTVKQVELDFTPTAAAFSDFMSHTGNIFSRQNNALVDLVSRGVPSILENQIDCKRDLESQLKLACESFIVRTYEQALAQLIAFLQRASKPLSDQTQVFQEQPFAKPDRFLLY